jgi:acyl-CoA synthetase (AMP-forming)/AMP-acid ligase II
MSPFVPLVRRLEASALREPAAEAVVQGHRRVHYGELWANIQGIAAFLRAQGVARGDRVAVVLENCPEYIASYYGALAVGAVAVGMNAAARSREIGRWLEHCGARWVVLDAGHPDYEELASRQGCGVIVVGATPAADGRVSWVDAAATPPAALLEVEAADPAAIIYTSGTTGRPKGVVLTHGNLSANTAAIVDYLRLTAADRVLNLLPFFYSYGNSVLHTHLAVGGTLVLENHLVYPQKILSRIAEERITGLPGVPSTFALLLQASELSESPLARLRYLTQAGGAMTPRNISRVREQLGSVELFIMYGQTEATARLTYLPPALIGEKLGSVGRPVAGVELEIRDDAGQRMPTGVTGQVCVRGASVMAGYYADREATEAVLRDGWLHTGDLGYLDADGCLYLEGRRSDMIKSGAHRLSPLDIEDVIAMLPEVAEVAVVGVPDEVLGEAIKAVVTLRPGAILDAMTIQRHCVQQLPRYKVPRTVEFADRLPRTSSGKIMRYRLADTSV